MNMNNPEDMQNEIDELYQRVELLEKCVDKLISTTSRQVETERPNLDNLTLEMVGKAVAETLKEHGDT